MTVLGFEIHENLVDHHDLIDKMRAFAVTKGWTVALYQTNSVWANQGGGVYAWDPGSEDFLILTSPGFGSQDLQFRFRVEDSGAVATHEWVQINGYTGSTALDPIFTHPLIQTTIGTPWTQANRHHSFPSQTIPKTWFFGNDKIIIVVVEVDSTFCVTMVFGSVNLFDTTEIEGNLYMPRGSSSSVNHWFNHNTLVSFDFSVSDLVFYDAEGKVNSGTNFSFNTSGLSTNTRFGSLGDCVLRNAFSEIRPMFKQTIYTQRNSDSRYLPLGDPWVFRLDTEGLGIGEKICLGTKEFLAFPNGRVNERFKGFAVQIAS